MTDVLLLTAGGALIRVLVRRNRFSGQYGGFLDWLRSVGLVAGLCGPALERGATRANKVPAVLNLLFALGQWLLTW